MAKVMGIICLAVCLVCIAWIGISMFFTVSTTGDHLYRFDGVSAAEGTTLTVRNGELILAGNTPGSFSVDKPIRRIIATCLWGACFLTTLSAGIILLRFGKTGKARQGD